MCRREECVRERIGERVRVCSRNILTHTSLLNYNYSHRQMAGGEWQEGRGEQLAVTPVLGYACCQRQFYFTLSRPGRLCLLIIRDADRLCVTTCRPIQFT